MRMCISYKSPYIAIKKESFLMIYKDGVIRVHNPVSNDQIDLSATNPLLPVHHNILFPPNRLSYQTGFCARL